MKVLAIGAHSDDVELGCGGSLVKWSHEGHRIHIHIVTDSAYADPAGNPIRSADDAKREAEASALELNADLTMGTFACFGLPDRSEALATHLVGLVREVAPDVMLTHWNGDSHADHRAVALAAIHAARHVPTVLGYRSNWYPGKRAFDPRAFVDIGETLDKKLELIRLFKSENERTKGSWETQIRRDAEAQGYAQGINAAEAFEVHSVRL